MQGWILPKLLLSGAGGRLNRMSRCVRAHMHSHEYARARTHTHTHTHTHRNALRLLSGTRLLWQRWLSRPRPRRPTRHHLLHNPRPRQKPTLRPNQL